MVTGLTVLEHTHAHIHSCSLFCTITLRSNPSSLCQAPLTPRPWPHRHGSQASTSSGPACGGERLRAPSGIPASAGPTAGTRPPFAPGGSPEPPRPCPAAPPLAAVPAPPRSLPAPSAGISWAAHGRAGPGAQPARSAALPPAAAAGTLRPQRPEAAGPVLRPLPAGPPPPAGVCCCFASPPPFFLFYYFFSG